MQLVLAYGLSGKYFFDGNGLKPTFEKIADIISSDMPDSDMQAVLQGIFVEIISKLSVAVSENKHSDEALKLKNYLDSNISHIVSTAELAKTIFRSQDYCQKLFSREFGITPYAYQLVCKMQTAKSLLADTDISVGEIAEKLGAEVVQIIGTKFTDLEHEGKIKGEDMIDIADIITGKHPGRENDDEIIVYSVGGMPVEDIAWGGTVYRNAVDKGIGIKLPLWDKPEMA